MVMTWEQGTWTQWEYQEKARKYKNKPVRAEEYTSQNEKYTGSVLNTLNTCKKYTGRIENVFEDIMVENLPNLKKEIDTQIQEAQRDRKKTNPSRPTLRHIITRMAKKKKKIREF